MEDVLNVYHLPQDEEYPVVCMDETSKRLIEKTRPDLPLRPGDTLCYDYEYKRNGVRNLFLAFAPLEGWRRVEVTPRRTRKDWAEFIRQILEENFPKAKKVILVMDNLNTHNGASFYEAFPPEKARSLLDRLEIHYTPKHGSWLNMAEGEFSILQRQCSARRIGTEKELKAEIAAWQAERNGQAIGADWQFTAEDARIKLRRLYPSVEG
jgi:transposase